MARAIQPAAPAVVLRVSTRGERNEFRLRRVVGGVGQAFAGAGGEDGKAKLGNIRNRMGGIPSLTNRPTRSPVSSNSSRRAVGSGVSPAPTRPPGKLQSP